MLLSVCVAVRYYSRLFEESLTFLGEMFDDEAGDAEVIILFNQTDARLSELAERTIQKFPRITFIAFEGTRSRRDLFWNLASEGTGKYVWFLDDGVLPTKGSASLIMSIMRDDKLADRLKVLMLNTGKFAEDYRREMAAMEELVVFKTIKESTRYDKGLDLLNAFNLEDLLDVHSMVFERESFLKSTFVQHPEQWDHPHLRAFIELASRGATCYFPRICTLARDTKLAKDKPRLTTLHFCELPVLYKLAADRGVPKSKSLGQIQRILDRNHREAVSMLLAREHFRPQIEGMWKHCAGSAFFWFMVFPLDVLFTPAPLRRFFRKMLAKSSPDLVYNPA